MTDKDNSSTSAADRVGPSPGTRNPERPGGQRIPQGPNQPAPGARANTPEAEARVANGQGQHQQGPAEVTEQTVAYDPEGAARVFYEQQGRVALAQQLGLEPGQVSAEQVEALAGPEGLEAMGGAIVAEDLNRRMMVAFIVGAVIMGLVVYLAVSRGAGMTPPPAE